MKEDAEDALGQIDGANAIGKSYLAELCNPADENLGQPIQLTLLSSQGQIDAANEEPFPCPCCPLMLPHTYTDNARWRYIYVPF